MADLYDERDRSLELEIAARRSSQGPLSDRRGGYEAALPGLEPVGKEWTMPPREWCMAKAQFAVLFGERFSKAAA